MKTVFTMIIAASFAASAVHAEEAKPAGQTVAIAQQNDLPPGGLNPAVPFAIVGLGAFVAVGIAFAIGDDDDNNSTNGTDDQ